MRARHFFRTLFPHMCKTLYGNYIRPAVYIMAAGISMQNIFLPDASISCHLTTTLIWKYIFFVYQMKLAQRFIKTKVSYLWVAGTDWDGSIVPIKIAINQGTCQTGILASIWLRKRERQRNSTNNPMNNCLRWRRIFHYWICEQSLIISKWNEMLNLQAVKLTWILVLVPDFNIHLGVFSHPSTATDLIFP